LKHVGHAFMLKFKFKYDPISVTFHFECASPAKRWRYGKTNLTQCSKSGSGKSVGKVSIFRGEQPVNNQQSSEAEYDQLTQVSELEIENISSTVIIL
jgi:hypothetical protein